MYLNGVNLMWEQNDLSTANGVYFNGCYQYSAQMSFLSQHTQPLAMSIE